MEIDKLKKIRKPSETNKLHGGTQLFYEFENGFGASVVCHPFSYGEEKGLVELAVLKRNNICYDICYDSGITDDVLGYLTAQEAESYLARIESLNTTSVSVQVSVKVKE